MAGLSPKLPVLRDSSDGYALTKTYTEMVLQNLKNLLLTIPGERMMDPLFGVGIKRYLFEQNSIATYSAIAAKINEQVGIYMPFVEINDVVFSGADGLWSARSGPISDPDEFTDPNSLQMKVYLTIIPLDELSTLNLDFQV